MFVAMARALRPARRGERESVAGDPQRRLVAIDVIAARGREAQQQRVAVGGDGFDGEGLFRRERLRIDAARGAGVAEQSARRRAACEELVGVRGRLDRERHLQGAHLRRVAHAQVRAALVLHLDRGRGGIACRRAGVRHVQLRPIGFDIAEEFVVLRMARWQGERAARKTFGVDAMAVEVIAGCDAPGQQDAIARLRFRLERKGLVDGEEILFVDRAGRGREQRANQQRQQGKEGDGSEAHRGWVSRTIQSR
jgi:hypothetical protein